MTDGSEASPREGAPRQSGRRAFLDVVLGCLALAVAVGVAWWLLAPSGRVLVQPGYLLALDDAELVAGQDVVLAGLGLLAGLVVGVWVAVRSATLPVHRAAGALVGSLAGSLLAWQIGRLLRPGGAAVEATAAVQAPLDVHALGVLVVWPATTTVVAFVVLLVDAWRAFDRPAR